jgi:hypothetical protein
MPRLSRALAAALFLSAAACGRCGSSRLSAVGPRVVSNQAAYPLAIHGEGLPDGARLRLSAPASLELPTARIDARHLTALLPSIDLPADRSEVSLDATLVRADGTPIEGGASIAVINDRGYPMPSALALSPDAVRARALARRGARAGALGNQRRAVRLAAGRGRAA